MEKLSKVLKGIDKCSTLMGKIGGLIIPVIATIEMIEVIRRYVFASPTFWAYELCTYLYGASFMLAGAWALLEGKHVRTDVVFAKFSKKGQKILDLITYCVCFLPFMGIMVWKSGAHMIWSVKVQEEVATMWNAPIWWLKIIIAASFTMLLLQGIAHIIRSAVYVWKGEEV